MFYFNKLMHSENIFETVAPFYYKLKCFGFVPYKLDYKNRKISSRFVDILHLFSFISLLSYLLYRSFDDSFTAGYETYSSLLMSGWRSVFQFELLSGIFINLMNFFQRKTIEKLLETVFEFDQEVLVANNGVDGIDHKKEKRNIVLCITANYFQCFGMMCISLSVVRSGLNWHDVAFLYLALSYALISEQFIFGCYCIKRRFFVVNGMLR